MQYQTNVQTRVWCKDWFLKDEEFLDYLYVIDSQGFLRENTAVLTKPTLFIHEGDHI